MAGLLLPGTDRQHRQTIVLDRYRRLRHGWLGIFPRRIESRLTQWAENKVVRAAAGRIRRFHAAWRSQRNNNHNAGQESRFHGVQSLSLLARCGALLHRSEYAMEVHYYQDTILARDVNKIVCGDARKGPGSP
jgi:hypothetical protein